MIDDGIHLGLSPELYHADPAPISLSNSILHCLLSQSPLHAFTAHPRLCPDWRPEELDSTQQSVRDYGSALHAMVLEGEVGMDRVAVAEFDDWRKRDAQEMRVEARAAGRIPLLLRKFDEAQRMAAAIHEQIAASEIAPLFGKYGDAGQSEVTLVWTEDGVRCRARCDWMRNDGSLILDLKTTSLSAHPSVVARQLWGLGADCQAAFYARGVRAVLGADATFVFMVAENKPPYAMSLIALPAPWLEIARRKIESGIGTWHQCLAENSWPGYTNRISYPELPAYLEASWIERELE